VSIPGALLDVCYFIGKRISINCLGVTERIISITLLIMGVAYMPTLEQLKDLSESRCQFRCRPHDNFEYELSRCSCVLAFLGAAAREIGDNMRVDATFSLGAEEMYGLSYLLEGFQKSVDVLLDSKGRRAA